MDLEDPGMNDHHLDDEDEMMALLDEHCPVPELTRRTSFSKKRLSFSSPIRPNESCLVELHSDHANPNAPANLTDSAANAAINVDEDEPDWTVDNVTANSSSNNANELRTLSQDYRQSDLGPNNLTVDHREPDVVLDVASSNTNGDSREANRTESQPTLAHRSGQRRARYSVQTTPNFYSMFDGADDDGFAVSARSLMAMKALPAHTNYITMTSSLGGSETRLYLTRMSSDHYKNKIQNLTRRWKRNMNRNQLLTESVELLLERIEKKRVEQLVRDEEASLALAETMLVEDLEGAIPDSDANNKKRRLEDDQPNLKDASSLFVDRFAPKTFLELLSDSRINREVLQWVQAWDPTVFHRPARSRPKSSPNALNQSGTSPFHRKTRGSSFPNKRARPAPWIPHNPGFERGPDQRPDDHRPYPRALLFAGPPGSGKTTLAHCIARQAGYNVVEINASDDRSVSTLRSKIIRAISMESVLGDCKPNLIILDEIDGVEDAAAVRALIEIVTDSASSDPRKKSKKNKSQSVTLQRPIICICNDLYAKILRPLRAVVLTYTFSEPTTMALQQRISHICSQTGLQIDSSGFRCISEQSRNDIRSALQVLQFVAANARLTGCYSVGRQDVMSFVSDQKDLAVDHFAIWKAVFSQATRLHDVIDSVISYKDSSKLVDGLFEFYTNMSYSDPTMSKTLLVSDCFSYMDTLSAALMRSQDFSGTSYIGLTAGTVHHYCSVKQVPKITPPKQAFQHSRDLMESRDILSRFNSQLTSRYTDVSVVTEIIPALYHIITPRMLRSECTMMSNQDELLMARICSLMQKFGLNYTIVSDTDRGQLRRDLQPDISRFCRFSTPDGDSFLYRLPSIWIERIAREISLGSRSLRSQTQTNAATAEAEPVKGWQGSFKLESSKPSLGSTLSMVRFRYNEGFTQAVRRPIRIATFLPAKM